MIIKGKFFPKTLEHILLPNLNFFRKFLHTEPDISFYPAFRFLWPLKKLEEKNKEKKEMQILKNSMQI